MALVFGLKYGLPKELQFIGSILEDSDGIGIGIANMPREAKVTVNRIERLDEARRRGGDMDG